MIESQARTFSATPRLPGQGRLGHGTARNLRSVAAAVFVAALVGSSRPADPLTAAAPTQPMPADTLRPVVEYGGEIGAVATDGARAYVAVHSRIHVFDPALPDDGRPLGTSIPLGAPIVSIAARDGRVLASAGSRLYVLDMQDPRDIELRSIMSVGSSFGVTWVGNEAWLAMGIRGLFRVDVSDPERPSRPRRVSLEGSGLVEPHFIGAVAEGGPGAAILLPHTPGLNGPSALVWMTAGTSKDPSFLERVNLAGTYDLLSVVGDRAVIGPPRTSPGAPVIVVDYEPEPEVPSQMVEVRTPEGERYLGDLHWDGRYLWRMDREGQLRRQDLDSRREESVTRRILPNDVYDQVRLLRIGDRVLMADEMQMGGIVWHGPDDPPQSVLMADADDLGTGKFDRFQATSEGAWAIDTGLKLHFLDKVGSQFEARFAGASQEETAEPVGEVRAMAAGADLVAIAPRTSLTKVWQTRHLGEGVVGDRIGRSTQDQAIVTPWSLTENWMLWSIEGIPYVQPNTDGSQSAIPHKIPPPSPNFRLANIELTDNHVWVQRASFVGPEQFTGYVLDGANTLRATNVFTVPTAIGNVWDVDGTTLALGQATVLTFISAPAPHTVRQRAILDLPSTIADVALDGDRAWACWIHPRLGASVSLLDISRLDHPRDAGQFSIGDARSGCSLQAAGGLGWNLSQGALQAFDLGTIRPPNAGWWLDPPGRVWLPWAKRGP